MISERFQSPVPPWRVHPGGTLGRFLLPQVGVGAITLAPDDDLWVAGSANFVVFRHGWWYHSSVPNTDGVQGYGPFAWYRGRLWAGGEQLVVRDRERWAIVGEAPFAFASHLATDDAGFLWVGSGLNGVWRTPDGVTWEHVELPSQGQAILALHCGETGGMWVAERGQRPAIAPICCWREGRWETLPLPRNVRSFDYISALSTDRRGRLWAGTFGHGVFLWEEGTWQHFGWSTTEKKPGLPAGDIRGLAVDKRGRLWAGTGGGMAVYDGDTWRTVLVALEYDPRTGDVRVWSPDSCRALHLDHDGKLWFLTASTQIGWFDTNQDNYVNFQVEEGTPYQPPNIRVIGDF